MPIQLLAKQVGSEHSHGSFGLLIPMNQLPELLVSTLAFSVIGLLLFALAFWIMGKATPFSIRKEIEEDQNTALAILIASVIIGIALIVSAAVHG
jgi:putative membrane protein